MSYLVSAFSPVNHIGTSLETFSMLNTISSLPTPVRFRVWLVPPIITTVAYIRVASCAHLSPVATGTPEAGISTTARLRQSYSYLSFPSRSPPAVQPEQPVTSVHPRLISSLPRTLSMRSVTSFRRSVWLPVVAGKSSMRAYLSLSLSLSDDRFCLLVSRVMIGDV